jgi:large subunit ribosomal protein L15e
MGYLTYVKQQWNKKDEHNDLWKERLIAWRKEPATLRLEHPTRIDRARALGYKAKQGYIVVRERIKRGGRMRADIKGGRRTAHSGQRLTLHSNLQKIAELRAVKAYPGLEVLNSYFVAKDGISAWYEIILVDKTQPSIAADHRINWMVLQRDRAGRGLTSAGKKSRGMRNKGMGAEKIRPSRRANLRRH